MVDKTRLEEEYAKYAASRQKTLEQSASVAKAVDPPRGLEGTALDRGNLKPAFERAVERTEPSKEISGNAGGVASKTIAEHAPCHNLKPPQLTGPGSDRQAYAEKLTADHRAARHDQLQAALKARQHKQDNGKMKDEKERD